MMNRNGSNLPHWPGGPELPRPMGAVREELWEIIRIAARETGFDVVFTDMAYRKSGRKWPADPGYVWLWMNSEEDTGPFWKRLKELKRD